jgi:hypothetical protein
VFLTGGNAPGVNARVSRLTMLNPRMTGEVNNGDSIEIQHRGTWNGVNIETTRLDLRDSRSRLSSGCSLDRNELLNPFAGFDLARIDVPLGIGGDAVDEVELSGHTAVVADRADGLS